MAALNFTSRLAMFAYCPDHDVPSFTLVHLQTYEWIVSFRRSDEYGIFRAVDLTTPETKLRNGR